MAAKAVIAETNDGLEFEGPNTTVAEGEAVVASTQPTLPTPAKNEDGGRKRKRHLFNAIRGQMEFYFGDANLSKDRFLRRYVEKDPCKSIFKTMNI